MEVQIKYPKAKCKYCGKTYTKQHGNQKYCSYNCKHNAKKEQTAKARMKHYYKNKTRGGDRQWGIGSGGLGQHRHTDPEQEYTVIQNEKRRLGI